MSYINANTFDIVHELQHVSNPDEYFKADELIALPIQVLNRKGYTTVSCCAGHSHAFENLPDKEKMLSKCEGSLPEGFDIETTVFTMNYGRSFISFADGISLPELPLGFVIKLENKNLIIEKHYDNSDDYGFMRDVIEAMEQLFKWALNLPDFKDEK